MPCSRMPKWSTRPAYGSPCHILVERSFGQERRRVLDGGVVGLGEVGRAAPELRHRLGDRVDDRAGGLAGRHPLRVGVAGRQVVGPAVGQGAGLHPLEEGARRPTASSSSAWNSSSHAAWAALPRSTSSRVCSSTPGGTSKVWSGSKPSTSLVAATSSVAERRAVRLAGVLGVGGGPGDDRAQHDEARPVGHRLGRLHRGVQRRHVLAVLGPAVGPVDGLHVPAVGLVARGDVLAERDVGVVLDRDLVGVVDQREVAELAGRRRCEEASARDALLDVAVAADAEDPVVERRGAVRGVGVEQAALPAGGHRHADGVADALAERAGGGLDAGGVAVLGVAGRLAAPGPQRLEVLELQAPAAEEQLQVEGQRRVPARRARTGRGPASPGRPGCAASPSGTAGTPPARGSSRCRGGRCRPSARRPSPAPARCPRPCRPDRSSPASR